MSRFHSILVGSAIAFCAACGSVNGDAQGKDATGGTSGTAGNASGGGSGAPDSGASGSSATGGRGGTSGTGGAGGTSGTNGAGGTPNDSGVDGVSGSSGTGGAGSTPNDSGADGGSDFDKLERCSSGSCPGYGLAQLIENSAHNINVASVGCVLRALRDRTPGRYSHKTDSAFTNGNVGANHVIVVAENGSVAYARSRYNTSPQPYFSSDPGQRCQLKPASYFTACLAALERGQTDQEAWRCAFGDGDAGTPSALLWFENCAPETPVRCQ